jgi:uncharacterized protein (DUF2225 family)
MKNFATMNKFIFIISILCLLATRVNATTWYPAKHTCPVCKYEGEYQDIGSYGGYIYQWPSKYQYIYWPLTDIQSVYCCTKCHFSTYMWDFDSVPENKIDTLKLFLATVKIKKGYTGYLDIPMTTRLGIAENVYKILGRDTEFWCKFYRVLGYHYDEDKNTTQARESRLKSLGLARQMLVNPAYSGQEKEVLLIMAAMYNFTGNKDSALIYLDEAALKTYQNKTWEEDNAKGLDDYLTELINNYQGIIRKEEEK